MTRRQATLASTATDHFIEWAGPNRSPGGRGSAARPSKSHGCLTGLRVPPRAFASALLAATLALLGACAGRAPEFPTQRYVPTTREMLPLGQLLLSNRMLQFAGLEGEMKLEYVGIMPESAGADIAGSTIYRVKNSAAYFEENNGKNAFCSEAPLWVAVSSRTGAPAWSQEIWVGLLTLKDWAQFQHGQDRVCAGGDFIRTPG